MKFKLWSDVILIRRTQLKLEAAEARLKDSLLSLCTRWVVEEKTALTLVALKLDVSIETVYKLITLFELEKHVSANRLTYKNNNPLRGSHYLKKQCISNNNFQGTKGLTVETEK